MIWNNINWRWLAQFLILVSAVAVFIQWLFERSWSPASIWGYIGTASIVFSSGLVIFNKRLWRLRVGKRRLFGWITKMPDISGEWNVEMTTHWKHHETFSSHATIKQDLFSIQVDFIRDASRSQSLSASIYSTAENRWKLACVYENEPESKPEKGTARHYGCLLLAIDNPNDSISMSGPYWTNKKTKVPLSQLPDFQDLQVMPAQIRQRKPSQVDIPVHATSGHAVFTRNASSRSTNSVGISPA